MMQRSKNGFRALLVGALGVGGCVTVSDVEFLHADGAPGNTCGGQCVPLGPYEAGWTEPALLWVGDPAKTPACPASAPVGEDVGFADPVAPTPCGVCACDPPAGACAIPTKWSAHNTASCPAPPGSVATPFDAFVGWDGSCTTANAIPADKKCNGSACVQSLSIAPLTLTETLCMPRMDPVLVPKDSSAPWGTLARVCRGHAQGECGDPGELCTPSATLTNAGPSSDSFAQCLSHDGDVACSGAFAVKHVFYKSFVDNRVCAPCSCGLPTGGTCKTLVSSYSDGTCSALVGSYTVDATETSCHDILPQGASLGSKSAQKPIYTPGTCQPSGGETMGEVVPTEPTTFCCLP